MTEVQAAEPAEFLIYSDKWSKHESRPMFYRDSYSGYTFEILEAGRYKADDPNLKTAECPGVTHLVEIGGEEYRRLLAKDPKSQEIMRLRETVQQYMKALVEARCEARDYSIRAVGFEGELHCYAAILEKANKTPDEEGWDSGKSVSWRIRRGLARLIRGYRRNLRSNT